MIKTIKYIFLFCSIFVFSQKEIKNIHVIYGKKAYNSNLNKIKDPNVLERIKSINNSFKNVEYELIANKQESYFSYIDKMQNDGNKISPRVITSGQLEGKYYANTNEKLRLQSINLFNKKFIIKESINKYIWNISTENKKIKNCIC